MKEGHAGPESIYLMETLRKHCIDGSVAFLHGALQLLVEGIMDAEVSTKIGTQYDTISDERDRARLFPMLYLPLVKPRAP